MSTEFELVNNKQEYSLTKCETIIENNKVLEYGIEQKYINDLGELIITRFDSISDEEGDVIELLERLRENDVYPATLCYIVDDYLGEIHGVKFIV